MCREWRRRLPDHIVYCDDFLLYSKFARLGLLMRYVLSVESNG